LRLLFITILLHIGFVVFCQKITILDYDSKQPLDFALFHSNNNKCFGYSDKQGKIILSNCSTNDTISIDYLGYQSLIFTIKDFKLIDTVFLKKISYDLGEVKILANRINIVDELNLILRKYRKSKYDVDVNTYFFLESFAEDSILERIELLGSDNISQLKFENSKRVVGSFLIKKENPYFSLDIDNFIKNIAFFSKSKSQYNHIFSKSKIKRKRYDIKLLTNNDHIRLIEYNKIGCELNGVVKYNAKSNEILEHEYTLKSDLNKTFKSLNKTNKTLVDSIKLHYYFTNNHLDLILFKIWLKKDSEKTNRKITTKGYLKVFNSSTFIDKFVIPNITYNSLQEELIYSSPLNFLLNEYNDLFVLDSTLYKNADTGVFLMSSDTLTYNLLNFFNSLSGQRKIWAKNKRLSLNDFIFREPIMDYNSNSISFLSDLQKFKIEWIIIKKWENGKVKYYSQKSIWNINESKILFYGARQAELIANMCFDIYEIYRRQLLFDLNNGDIKDEKALINEMYEKASMKVRKFMEITKYGRDLKKLKEYNNFIIENLGIDNLKIIFNKSYQSNLPHNTYSDGDMLAFFGKYQAAVDIYLSYLNDKSTDKRTMESILLNLCIIYDKLNDIDGFCRYYKELLKINPRYKENNFHIVCPEK